MSLRVSIASTLFVFAHQAEAQAFITHWKARPVACTPQFPLKGKGLYQKSDDETTLILITGEGEDWVVAKCAAVLSLHQDKIKKVVNMGIAGAIINCKEKVGGIGIGDIYAIKNVFRHRLNGEKLTLQCGPDYIDSVNYADYVDCVTSIDSDSDFDSHLKREHFILIDRELWGIAVSCALFKLPLYSYKIISDFPKREGEKAVINSQELQEIKVKASFFSNSLFNFFNSSILQLT